MQVIPTILMLLCSMATAIGQTSIFSPIDTILSEAEKTKQIIRVYGRNFSRVDQWPILLEKYPAYEALLRKDTFAHAKALRLLATIHFYKGDLVAYDSLRSASFEINKSKKHYYGTLNRDAISYFHAGDFKKCEESLKQMAPFKAEVLAKGFFTPVIVDYFDRYVGLAFAAKDMKTFQQNFEEYIQYFELHKSEFDKNPHYYSSLNHVVSLKAMLHLERKEYMDALYTMVEGIEKGYINLEQTKGIATNFYVISTWIYKELGENERAEWAKKQYKALVEAGDIHPYFIEYYEGVNATMEEDWEAARKSAANMIKGIEQYPMRFGLSHSDYYTILTDYYIAQSELDSALMVLPKFQEISVRMGLPQLAAYGNIKLGEVYQAKADYEQAVFYLKKAKEQSEQIGHTGYLYDINELLLSIAMETDNNTLLVQSQNELLLLQKQTAPYRADKMKMLQYMAENEQLFKKDGGLNEKQYQNLKVFGILLSVVFLIVGGIFYKRRKGLQREKANLETTVGALENQNSELASQQSILKQEKKEITSKLQTFQKKNLELASQRSRLQQEKAAISNKLQTITEKNQSTETLLAKLNESVEANSWEDFEVIFHALHPDFIPKLVTTFPKISATQQRHAMCMRMGLTIKKTADLLFVSDRTVQNTRYGMKKLFNLPPKEKVANFLKRL